MRCGLLFAACIAIFPAQAANQTAATGRYGAIAYHRESQSWGLSFDKARVRDANVQALQQCGRKECEVVHKFRNGCAALAEGPKTFAALSGATRMGVVAYAKSLADEVGRDGILVNNVCPGSILSERMLSNVTSRAKEKGISVEEALADPRPPIPAEAVFARMAAFIAARQAKRGA